jgi:hypothetical protein
MDGILDVLSDLKINRKLSSEADKLFQPFIGTSEELSFSLIEANTTYSTRLGEIYKGGKTILAKIVGTELECSILCAKDKNEWVARLAKGDEFTFRVNVLQLDHLYQRVVFGQYFEDDELELSNPEPVVTENLKDEGYSSQNLQSNQKGANSLNEDLEWERFMLLNLLTETVHRKPEVFGADYSRKLLDKKSKDREDSPTEEKKKSDYERGQEIVRHIYRFLGGVLAMFSSFVGYMTDNHLFSFIAFCIGLYLLFPAMKKVKRDYKKDRNGKYSILFIFFILILLFTVENRVVSGLLLGAAGFFLFTFFKKKFEENYKKY